MSPYITVKEAANRTGLSGTDLATLRWNRRHGEDDAMRFVFLSAGKSAAPLYDEASVLAWIEQSDANAPTLLEVEGVPA